MKEYLIFVLDGVKYGINVLKVQEISVSPIVTKLPFVGESVCGLINLRGSVVPLFDLKKIFGIDSEKGNLVISCHLLERTIAFLVDDVEDFKKIEDFERVLFQSSIPSEFVEAFLKVDGEMLIILDIEAIFSKERVQEY